MTDYTKEAEERIYPTYEQSGGGKNWDEMTELEQAYYNLRKAYNAFDVMKNTYLRVRQQSAAEIDRLRGEVERLTIDNMAHEFNQAEAEKFAPEYKRQIREDEANKWKEQVRKLREGLEEMISTIERNAVDNRATIENVKLWAKSWREELLTETEG